MGTLKIIIPDVGVERMSGNDGEILFLQKLVEIADDERRMIKALDRLFEGGKRPWEKDIAAIKKHGISTMGLRQSIVPRPSFPLLHRVAQDTLLLYELGHHLLSIVGRCIVYDDDLVVLKRLAEYGFQRALDQMSAVVG